MVISRLNAMKKSCTYHRRTSGNSHLRFNVLRDTVHVIPKLLDQLNGWWLPWNSTRLVTCVTGSFSN